MLAMLVRVAASREWLIARCFLLAEFGDALGDALLLIPEWRMSMPFAAVSVCMCSSRGCSIILAPIASQLAGPATLMRAVLASVAQLASV